MDVKEPVATTTTTTSTTTTTTTTTTSTSTTTTTTTITTTTTTTTASMEITVSENETLSTVTDGDYYDYSHFDYVNEMMNSSFVATVLEEGEEEYLEILFNGDITNHVDEDQYLETLAGTEPGHKSSNADLTGGDGTEAAEGEEENEKDVEVTKEIFVKSAEEVGKGDEKLKNSAVNSRDKKRHDKKRTRNKNLENETFFKESPLTMNSAGQCCPVYLAILLSSLLGGILT